MTYEEIKERFPKETKLRKADKLSYRYPRGESYLDVISRLDPLVQELESYQEPVLIVGHQGVLRLIYAYFTGMDRTEACNASIPLNTVRVHLYLYLQCIYPSLLIIDNHTWGHNSS